MRTIHYNVSGSRYTFYLNGRKIGQARAESLEDAAKVADIRHAEFLKVSPSPYEGLTESQREAREESRKSYMSRHGFYEMRWNPRKGCDVPVWVEHPTVDLVPVLDMDGCMGQHTGQPLDTAFTCGVTVKDTRAHERWISSYDVES